MITEHTKCRRRQSSNIVRNGSNSSGNAKYKCKDCNFGGVFVSRCKSDEFKETVIRASQEHSSSRGLARVFGISHQTALNWIKKSPFLS